MELQSVSYSRHIVMRLLDIIIGLIELMLGVRLVLRFLGASATSSFVAWLYSTTDQLLYPFAGMFPSYGIFGNSIIELSVIFAMIAYAFFGWLIMRLISFLTDAILYLDTSL